MGLRKFFGGSKKKEVPEEEYTIEDLFVLERYEDAETRLKERLKRVPTDLHAHLRLADVYIQQRRLPQAVDEYVYVAEEYAADGFFDKGIALLSKVLKLAPTDENLPLKIEKIRQRKRLERVREQALDGLREGAAGSGGRGGTSAVELQSMWGSLLRSSLVRLLDGPQLKRLFSSMTLKHVDVGTVLGERNSNRQELFLVVRGEVEATATVGETPVMIRKFGPGDVIGEGSVLEQKLWPATYLVTTQATVLRLTREGLERVFVGNPDPRGLIDALRDQQHDRDVTNSIRKLSES